MSSIGQDSDREDERNDTISESGQADKDSTRLGVADHLISLALYQEQVSQLPDVELLASLGMNWQPRRKPTFGPAGDRGFVKAFWTLKDTNLVKYLYDKEEVYDSCLGEMYLKVHLLCARSLVGEVVLPDHQGAIFAFVCKTAYREGLREAERIAKRQNFEAPARASSKGDIDEDPFLALSASIEAEGHCSHEVAGPGASASRTLEQKKRSKEFEEFVLWVQSLLRGATELKASAEEVRSAVLRLMEVQSGSSLASPSEGDVDDDDSSTRDDYQGIQTSDETMANLNRLAWYLGLPNFRELATEVNERGFALVRRRYEIKRLATPRRPPLPRLLAWLRTLQIEDVVRLAKTSTDVAADFVQLLSSSTDLSKMDAPRQKGFHATVRRLLLARRTG